MHADRIHRTPPAARPAAPSHLLAACLIPTRSDGSPAPAASAPPSLPLDLVFAAVVALDEKEAGVRSTLNFGHTIGHAVEGLASPALLHGECVSIGMVYEAVLARDLGELAPSAVGRITRILKSYALPIDIPKQYLRVPELMGKMAVDKGRKTRS